MWKVFTRQRDQRRSASAASAGLQLVDCPIRHLGTEKAQQLYLNIQNYLLARGVEMLFNTECDNILLEGSECKGVVITEKGERRELRADQVVIATAVAVQIGWKSCAPSTTLPTNPAPLILVCVWSAATRSWRPSTRFCTKAS